ncbi:uncharacterized protein LOC119557541 isoform X2 [Drosophila subpulchrella]|uniref:uncharacterized protein LOC119557541 isoform X2 n=1 Tax=Drosophila subpulchrella TaxID=1486046 RepID=UPI0018A12965|nr:uncharacterized protein LOC119557541 isoform X2 [Drosophila subpulchrella]
MDATWAMEQLLAAVELSRTQNEDTTPTTNTAISIWSAPSEGSASSCVDPASFRFRLDGQAILPPLITSAKRREVQLARQKALKLEERYRLARHSAGSDMASLRSLSQTETFIYDSTRGQARPQTPVPDIKLPTIQVDPPTPHPPVEPVDNLSPRRHNRITDRILQFEQSGLGKLLPKDQDKRILRSSTSPLIAECKEQTQQELKKTELGTSQPEPASYQRSRSFTLEEPSQVLVEHMQREAQAVKPSQSLVNFQRQTIESQAKRVNRNSRCNSNNTAIATNSTTTGSSCSRRDREVERIIERALGEHGPLEASRKAGVRNYLRSHRERMNQLVLYQEEERRRMQTQFDQQQRQLIEELCAEIDVTSSTENPDELVSQSTSTGDLQCGLSTPSMSFSNATPRCFQNLDDFLTMEDSCRMAASSFARKRLFSPKVSLGYESEPQLLGETTAPSTPRSLPLRNSSLTNSRRSGPVARRRSQTVSSSSRKSNITAGREVIKSPAKVLQGRPKSSPGNASSTPPKRGNAPVRSSSSPKQLRNKHANLEQEERQWAATRINAAVRGFLIRRLFATEQVQRIVQTIRDTLIFVLNLHLETCGNDLDAEEPANLRLKARLLQQLCSASRTLHLIFIQTNTKERLEIIARDRKRIKTKLLLKHS